MMGSILTELTQWIIIGMDFVMNLYTGLKIVYKLKYSKKENAEDHSRLQNIIYIFVHNLIVNLC